jgi:hypothetical protein
VIFFSPIWIDKDVVREGCLSGFIVLFEEIVIAVAIQLPRRIPSSVSPSAIA